MLQYFLVFSFSFQFSAVSKQTLNSSTKMAIKFQLARVNCCRWNLLEPFELILQNRKLICVIGAVQSYLGFWGERLNFGITIAEIQPKVWERRRKRWREKMLNFGNEDTEFPAPNSATRVCVECPKWKEKKNWQTNCGNAIAEIGKKKNL